MEVFVRHLLEEDELSNWGLHPIGASQIPCWRLFWSVYVEKETILHHLFMAETH